MFKPLLLGLGVAVLCSGCVSMTPKNLYAADTPRVVQPSCVRSTGSRIIRRDRDCMPVAGRSYSRQDMLSTGALSTADALSALDPALRGR